MKTISVPLELINLQNNGFHLLVEVVVFGMKRFAVLDTGASRSVFDKSFLEKNSLQELIVSEEINAATLFSSEITLQAMIPELKIGKLILEDYQTVALDLETVSQTYEQLGHPPIIAILGGDILMEYQAIIDYKKLVLKLYK